MITKRIIPCLDVKNGRVVKGTNFQGLNDVSSPIELAKYYSDNGADELVFYDITASFEERKLFTDILCEVAKNVFIPLTVGGGINTVEDFDRVLKCGADKVSVNSGAIKNPMLIKEAAQKYGNQCVVISADVKRVDGRFLVFAKGGRENTGIEAISWIKKCVDLGAGEVVVNSIDTDGVKGGFDIELLKQVVEAVNGMEALIQLKNNSFDLIIMDIMMPELDGFSACREIRKTSDIPIIMLSARGEEYDKINGFEIGIDDYVIKPFSPKELMLRVDAILKRSKTREKPSEPKNEVLSLADGGLVVDFTARIVYIDGERATMSPKEYDLFFYMLRNKNIALTRDKLLSDVWGYDFFGDDRTLDTHIKILRKSLGKYADYIVTIRGVGYRFEYK